MTASQVISGASISSPAAAHASCRLSLRSSSATIAPVSTSTGFTGQSLASVFYPTPGPPCQNEIFPNRLHRAASVASSSLPAHAVLHVQPAKGSSPIREPAPPAAFVIAHLASPE